MASGDLDALSVSPPPLDFSVRLSHRDSPSASLLSRSTPSPRNYIYVLICFAYYI